MQYLPTNIGELKTSGLLNSQASRVTTTNVGEMIGNKHSVINLGLMELPGQGPIGGAGMANKQALLRVYI